jgi:hypothetical protein
VGGRAANNILTVNVPLSDVGSPAVGSVLQYSLGFTQEVNDPALVPFTIDTGGAQNDYTVGQSCNGWTAAVLTGTPQTVLPEVPAAPALLLLGRLVSALAWRRRSRRTLAG